MIMMPVIVDLDTKQLTQAGESSRSCNSHSREEIVGNFQGFPVFDRSNLSGRSWSVAIFLAVNYSKVDYSRIGEAKPL